MLNCRSVAFAGVAAVMSAAPAAMAGSEVLLATSVYNGVGQTTALPTFQPYLITGEVGDPTAILNEVTLTLLDIVNGTLHQLTGDMPFWSAVLSDALTTDFHMGFLVPGGTGSNTFTSDFTVIQGSFDPVPGIGAPDFAPYTVTSVWVRGTSYMGDGQGGHAVTIEYYFYGVPTPGAGVTLALAGLVGLRRRR